MPNSERDICDDVSVLAKLKSLLVIAVIYEQHFLSVGLAVAESSVPCFSRTPLCNQHSRHHGDIFAPFLDWTPAHKMIVKRVSRGMTTRTANHILDRYDGGNINERKSKLLQGMRCVCSLLFVKCSLFLPTPHGKPVAKR